MDRNWAAFDAECAVVPRLQLERRGGPGGTARRRAMLSDELSCEGDLDGIPVLVQHVES